MSTLRTVATVAGAAMAAAILTFSVATTAAADPVDVGSFPAYVCLGGTQWEIGGGSSMFAGGLGIENAEVYSEPDCTGEVRNSRSFLNTWAVWIQPQGGQDASAYGLAAWDLDSPEYFMDLRRAANGDIVLLGPVESLSGLDVQVEHRLYADGDLARVLVSYTNPATEPITVATGQTSEYWPVSTEYITSTTGDSQVTPEDSWAVARDPMQGAAVISAAWQLPGAAWKADSVEVDWEHNDFHMTNLLSTSSTVTIAPGATIRLAYFMKIYGYEAGDMATAEAAAVDGVGEWFTFSDRLTAGLAPGTEVLNWGTVPGGSTSDTGGVMDEVPSSSAA